MSIKSIDKFLRTIQQEVIESGTQVISGESIGASNLVSGLPVKVDSNKNLESTLLAISDTNGLQTILDSTITNPYVGTLEATDFKSNSIASLETAINDNTTANSGTVVVHSDVSSAGSGEIITVAERTAIGDNTTAITTKVSKAGDTMTGNLNLSGSTIQQDSVDTYLPLQKGGTSNIFCGGGGASISGTNNTAVGTLSLNSVVGGSGNTAINSYALGNVTTGSNNIGIGPSAGGVLIGTPDITTESNNILIGNNTRGAGYSDSIVIGSLGQSSADNQCVIHNVNQIVSGSDNTCDLGSTTRQMKDLYLGGNIKQDGLVSHLPLEKGNADNLLCDGGNALTSGTSNTGFGNGVLNTITTETHCSAFGEGAMGGSKSTYSCAVGVASLYGSGTGGGTQNNAIGVFSQRVQNNGSNNNSMGFQSLTALTDGSNNIAIGTVCNQSLTTESNTISVGFNCNNLFNNSITLGHNSQSTASNQCVIHNVNQIVSGSDNTCDLGSTTRQMRDLYLGGLINSLGVIGNLFTQTATSATHSTQTTPTSILSTGVGSLTIPANTLVAGSSLRFKLGGIMTCGNGNELTLSFLGYTTPNIACDGATSNGSYELECEIVVRGVGATAATAINWNFAYYNNGGSLAGTAYDNTVTTIDTTTANVFDIVCVLIDTGMSINSTMLILDKSR